jgi:hypothetical protein
MLGCNWRSGFGVHDKKKGFGVEDKCLRVCEPSSSLHWAGNHRKSVVATIKIRQPLIRQRSGGFKLGASSPAVPKLAGLEKRSLGWRSSICSAKAQNGEGAGC